jgi:Tfp pilus assembly protein FimV
MHARSSSSLRGLAIAALAIGVSAVPARAQASLTSRAPAVDVSSDAQAPIAAAKPVATPAPAAGPTMDAASVAVRQPVSTEARSANLQARRAGMGQPIALMVVGGAALLTGLIIAGDAGTLIAVGGALIGLYGLYEYLQ